MKAWNYLSGWTNSFSLPSNIQKKLYKFLLKRAIGPFLENDLDLDNFDIELVNGSVELRELKLNLNKLNELLQDSCFMVEKGHVSSIHASLPWANHWSGVSIKIQGLELNLVPVKHKEQQHHRKPDISIEGSIMSSSLHFADDFLKSEVKQPDEQEDIQSQGDGIYILTRTIDKLFAQLRVDIIDTMIHIVHKSDAPLSPDSNNTCYSLDISIPRIAYFDETPEFNNNNHATNTIDESSVIVPNETIKIITISSPTVWLRSAPIIISEQSDVFYDANPYEALIFTTMDKSNWIRIKTIPYNENAFHIKQVDFLLTHSRIIITPSQFAFFMDLLNFTQQDQPPPTNTDILGDLDMRNQKHYTTIHSDNDAFERKIKIQISLIECFILHQHPSDNVSILDQDLVDLNQGHIRLTMDQLNIRIQQFSSHDQCVNIRLSDLTLDEWIETNHGLRCQPMIQFDDSIKTSYSHQDLFPSFYDTEQSFERSPVEVIRIKLDNKRGNISVDDDIYVDIQAFKLLVDPRTVDRLEQYVLAILNRSPSSSSRPTLPPPPPQNLDLSTSEVPTNTKLRIKCAFIRLILLSPDMSQATSRYEYTDKCHDYQLSVDIKKPVINWSSSPSEEKKKGRKESSSRNFALRINIELNYINVFMKEDGLVQCWFTVKTVQDKDLLSDTLSPSIELTIKDPELIHLQTDASEFELPRVLFDELRQGQKNMSIENQSDSALIFKQRTIETSQLVANCHFPQTYMNLTKKRWDKVQTIQNDLLLWQPRFLLNLEKSSEEQQQEGPSLLSIVAVMSQGLWYLQSSDDHLYTLDFSEFKYFACMKHLGRDENITTLDIEQLALNDAIKQRPLICRTLPKIMASSKNKPMVSIFSRLLLFPDMNRINKDSSVVVCNLCWKATPDISFIDQLIYFQQMPEDINLIDPPTQCVKVYTNVLETSIDYDPNDYPFRCVILADGIQVVTEILTGQSILEINISVDSIQLLFSELKHSPLIDEKNMSNNSTSEAYWTNLGLIPLAGLRSIELDVKLKLLDHIVAPKAEVALTNATIHLDTHADSFQSLINLITHLSTLKEDFNDGSESKQPSHKLHSPSTVKQFMNEQDMLASLDENAFKMMMSRETKISPPTLIEAPEIEDYEEEFYASPTIKTASPPMKPPRHIKRSEDIVRMLVSDELELVDDFYGLSSLNATSETRNTSERTSGAVLSLHVSHVNLVWKLYDGYDWDYVRAEMAARKHDRRTTSMTDQGGGFYQRKRDTAQMEVQLTGINVDFHLMPTHEKTVIRFQLRIKDVDIIDNIKTSAWKKFLGYMKSPTVFREKDEQMVDIQLTCLRPADDPELRLKAKLLPIRLYIDQDALNFLVGFFTFDKMIVKSTPIMNYIPSKEPKADETFFQSVNISPVTLKVDYKPKYINYGNLKEGQLAELINLFSLDGAKVSLCQIKLTGITGVDSLLDKIAQEWLPHIKQTQVPHMVSGVAPIRSLTNLGTGMADLVLLPIQQYRKDGRIMRGIQKGTISFARATAIEAIKLSSRVASGTQVILEHADDFFAGSQQSHQPQEHFVYTDEHLAQTILAVPADDEEDDDEIQQSSRNVIRAVPVAVIRPMIGLTGAFQSIFNGLRYSIDPIRRLQNEDKYKKQK